MPTVLNRFQQYNQRLLQEAEQNFEEVACNRLADWCWWSSGGRLVVLLLLLPTLKMLLRNAAM